MGDFRENIIPHNHQVTKEDRIHSFGHRPLAIWFVGLSGSGKSTLASGLESYFYNQKYKTYILDGDNIRSGLNSDLDFSDKSRKENIRRISEVAKLFVDAGTIVMTAFISPFKEDREKAIGVIGKQNFFEVYVECPLAVCEQRDVKGLYKKAREGKIKDFTGISSPFEIPDSPDLVVNTAEYSLDDCLKKLIIALESKVNL